MVLGFEPEPGMLVETTRRLRATRRPGLGNPRGLRLTLDLGHCVCVEPEPIADCIARWRARLVARPRRGHAAGRPRAPDVRRGRTGPLHRPRRRCGGRLPGARRRRALAPLPRRARRRSRGDRRSCARAEREEVARLSDPAGARARARGARQPEAAGVARGDAAEVAGQPAAIRTRFPSVGRKVGREPARRRARTRTTCTRGRSTTPRARCCSPRSAPAAGDELDDLYRYGDAAERRGRAAGAPVLDRSATRARPGRRRHPHATTPG